MVTGRISLPRSGYTSLRDRLPTTGSAIPLSTIAVSGNIKDAETRETCCQQRTLYPLINEKVDLHCQPSLPGESAWDSHL
jgi:hypothetical protein